MQRTFAGANIPRAIVVNGSRGIQHIAQDIGEDIKAVARAVEAKDNGEL